jgi:serine acetyltransferase
LNGINHIIASDVGGNETGNLVAHKHYVILYDTYGVKTIKGINILRLLQNFKFLFEQELQNHKHYDIKAKIPQSTKFQHNAIGVVIGSGAKIGEYCKIWQNVTIGASKFEGGIIQK